jgi:hypothetical protein
MNNNQINSEQKSNSPFQRYLDVVFIVFSMITITGIIMRFFRIEGWAITMIIGLMSSATLFILSAFDDRGLKGFKKTFHIIKSFTMGTFLIGVLFKLMHWPGGYQLKYFGLFSIIILFMIEIFTAFFYTKKIENNVKYTGILLVIVLAFNLINNDWRYLYSMVKMNEQIENKIQSIDSITSANFKTINESPDSLTKFTVINAIKKSHTLINKEINYIESLKKHILMECENSKLDTVTLKYSINKSNYDIPTHILIGEDDFSPKSGLFTAKELREKMNELSDNLIKIVEELEKDKSINHDFSSLKKKIQLIKPLDPGIDESGVRMSWESTNFYHVVMAACILNITQVQLEVKSVESTVLSELSALVN